MIKKTLFSIFVLMAMTAAAQKATITIDVNKPLHAVSPTLFGIFLEWTRNDFDNFDKL